MRHLALAYGAGSYVIFLGAFLYAVGFVGDLFVPKSINVPVGDVAWPRALIQDAALLLLFAVPHSVMARPGFKAWWTQFVPPPVERSTYVFKSSLLLIVLYWLWIPMPALVWEVKIPALRLVIWALFWFGWLLALVSTFLINHFDLFGLRQVCLFWMNRPYEPVSFRTPLLYRWVRHPLILGFLIAFWAAPTMTAGRLLFAVATTAYCLIALQLEEHDLLHFYGDQYAGYQKRVPMLVPIPRRTRRGP
ncbi:MAG: isoprenylcysteine carboxylmethyltransferase family protein [Planctomycetia bacterium]|nr:isoprenylcysteine carboxylmethyltransferase family protein [Planctomycetia bacterium]